MGGLVSVVLPTYDRRQFLEDSVESVLSQSYTNFELIVVESGSKDGTREYLHSIEDERLQVISQDRPHGLSNARNVALEAASGEYVVFLDDDDVLHEEAIEGLVETIRAQPPDCGGVYTAHRKVYPSGDTKPGRITAGEVQQHEVDSVGGPSCTLVRSTVFEEIGNFDETLPALEDVDLWIRLFESFNMYAIDRILYDRHYHDDQMIKDADIMLQGSRRIIEKHAEKLSTASLARRYYAVGRYYARLGQLKRARANLRRSLRLKPLQKATLYYCFWSHMGSVGYKFGRTGHDQIYRPFKALLSVLSPGPQ